MGAEAHSSFLHSAPSVWILEINLHRHRMLLPTQLSNSGSGTHTHKIMQSFFYTCSPTRTPVCTYKNKLFSHMSPISRDKEAHTSTYPPFSLQDDSCILRVCCLEWVSMLLQMFHRVGWQDQGQRTKKKKDAGRGGRGGRRPSQYLFLPWVVTCGWQTF